MPIFRRSRGEPEDVESVPGHLRPAVMEVLRRLVEGEMPEMLVWVREYGATLIDQPDGLWTHHRTYAIHASDGSWNITLPLWTTEESPSDLSAEVIVNPAGAAVVHDVHVL